MFNEPFYEWIGYLYEVIFLKEKQRYKQPFIHFIFIPSFLWEGRGGSSPGRLEIYQSFLQFQIVLLAQYKDRPSEAGDVIMPPGPWWTSGQLSRGCSQQNLPCQSSWDIIVTRWKHRHWDLSIRKRNWSIFRVLGNSELRTLSRSVTPWTLRKNPICAACTWDSTLSAITHDSWL